MEGLGAGRHGPGALAAGDGAEVLAHGGAALGLIAAPSAGGDLAAALAADLDVPVFATALDLQWRVVDHAVTLAALLRADVRAYGVLVPLQRDGASAAVSLRLEVRAVVGRDQPIRILAGHWALRLPVGESCLSVDLGNVPGARLEDVDLGIGLCHLHDLHCQLVRLVEVNPTNPEAGILLRGRVARRVDELRVRLVLLLLHQEDAAAVALGAGPEGNPQVP
mmetsp:Transcript_49223/g.142667  ORF Transcript_49223/g.142667 Transcript_49223/m.142667 type:complete len:222 (-) Transcript_49223:335-1000(-)